MTAYVIAHVEVLDPDGYKAYPARNTPLVERFGGRFVARGGRVEMFEGDAPPNRLVVIEFPSMDAARAWYHSPEYQEIAAIRQQYAHTHLLALVEGA